MRRVTWVLGAMSIGWLLAGCCSNGRFPGQAGTALIPVKRDENVKTWRVNGEKVCPKVIRAAPGCYVLEVEYGVSYTKYHPDKSGIGFISPAAGLIEQAAQTTHRSYRSGAVPFALRLRENANYYVTATFTGDEFLPRVIESDGTGARLQQIEPASSQVELDACRTGAPAPQKSAANRAGARLGWTPSESAEADHCD